MTGREMDLEKAKRIDIELRRRDLQESIDNSLTRIGHGQSTSKETSPKRSVRYLPDKTWARAFLFFLARERLRHLRDVEKIEVDIAELCNEWKLHPPDVKDLTWISTKKP